MKRKIINIKTCYVCGKPIIKLHVPDATTCYNCRVAEVNPCFCGKRDCDGTCPELEEAYRIFCTPDEEYLNWIEEEKENANE